MISTLVILAVFLQAPLAVHSLACFKCELDLDLNVVAPSVLPAAACTTTVNAVTCKALLRLNYYNGLGNVAFSGGNDTGFLLTNEDHFVTQRTMIRLNVDQFERSIEFNCYKDAWCVNATTSSYASGECAMGKICLSRIGSHSQYQLKKGMRIQQNSRCDRLDRMGGTPDLLMIS